MSALPDRRLVLGPASGERRERTSWRLCVFFALTAFASLQYAQLLSAPPVGRLLGAVAIATVGCGTLTLRRDGRPLLARVPVRVAVLLATLALATIALGVPAHLLSPASWPRLARHVEDGVAGLGSWLWPYRGNQDWSRLAVLLVVPVCLVAAGTICFWPGRGEPQGRRAIALALPVGLFLAGAANTPGSVPGLRGLVLLALIAAWLWLPGIGSHDAPRAARWLLACSVVALLVRPVLSSSGAWIGFRENVAVGVSFQWDQLYGPISWPRSAAKMLEVSEPHPELLRVTALDRFDGLRFLRSDAPPGSAGLDVGGGPRPRSWYTRAVVTVSGLRSTLLADGGGVPVAVRWLGRGSPAIARQADGTLMARPAAQAGGLYVVTSYTPQATPAMLRRAPRSYPRAYVPYTQFELPGRSASALLRPDLAADARQSAQAGALVGPLLPGRSAAADARVAVSPYGPMLALARGLARGASTDYDVAERIQRYLLANYAYDEHVPQARYPLEAFLFEQRRGYCQQFSGAMALMLRMDGIPARVASGFRPVVFDPSIGSWRLRALDAHSWVEVFFAGIGWVPFDPTPPAPVAVLPSSGLVSRSVVLGLGAAATGRGTRHAGKASLARRPKQAAPGEGSVALDLGIGLAALASLLLAGLWLTGHLRLRRELAGDASGAVGELERALERVGWGGRPMTLAQLERLLLLEGDEAAGRYLASLRELRFGLGRGAPPRVSGRAALRRALIARSGRRSGPRLLAALPPAAMRR